MKTSRAGAWAGNASAMLDLFGNNKIVYPSQVAMKPYMQTQAYRWEVFVLQAFPNKEELLVDSLRSKRICVPMTQCETASVMTKYYLVREEFPTLRENQKNSKWAGWCTTSGEATDEDLMEKSLFNPSKIYEHTYETQADFGFFINTDESIGFKLPAKFVYELYKKEIDKLVVHTRHGRATTTLDFFDGIALPFITPIQNQGLDYFLERSLILTEERYELKNKNKKRFPTFYEIGCRLFDQFLPLALAEGYGSFSKVTEIKSAALLEEETAKERERIEIATYVPPIPTISPRTRSIMQAAITSFMNKYR